MKTIFCAAYSARKEWGWEVEGTGNNKIVLLGNE